MDDEEPVRLNLTIAAFRAIASAVTEAQIGGEVTTVTISEIAPQLQLMRNAVAVELTVWDEAGTNGQPHTWIVTGDGAAIAHLERPRDDAQQE